LHRLGQALRRFEINIQKSACAIGDIDHAPARIQQDGRQSFNLEAAFQQYQALAQIVQGAGAAIGVCEMRPKQSEKDAIALAERRTVAE
jgi:hypothetical protein